MKCSFALKVLSNVLPCSDALRIKDNDRKRIYDQGLVKYAVTGECFIGFSNFTEFVFIVHACIGPFTHFISERKLDISILQTCTNYSTLVQQYR